MTCCFKRSKRSSIDPLSLSLYSCNSTRTRTTLPFLTSPMRYHACQLMVISLLPPLCFSLSLSLSHAHALGVSSDLAALHEGTLHYVAIRLRGACIAPALRCLACLAYLPACLARLLGCSLAACVRHHLSSLSPLPLLARSLSMPLRTVDERLPQSTQD